MPIKGFQYAGNVDDDSFFVISYCLLLLVVLLVWSLLYPVGFCSIQIAVAFVLDSVWLPSYARGAGLTVSRRVRSLGIERALIRPETQDSEDATSLVA